MGPRLRSGEKLRQANTDMDLLLTHGYFLSEDPKEREIMKPYAPLGLLYLSSHLRARGFGVEIYDSTFGSIDELVRLLETALMRVGNEEYAQTNKSFGITTLRNRHVRVHGKSITFDFRGKHGITHHVDLTDPRLARIFAYGLGGIFCAIGGVARTMTTGIGAHSSFGFSPLSSRRTSMASVRRIVSSTSMCGAVR